MIEILDSDEEVEQVIEIVEDYATETTEAASCARPSTEEDGEEDGDDDTSKTKAAHHATMKKMTKIHDNVTKSSDENVQWSSNGEKIVIKNWKEFTAAKQHTNIFGYQTQEHVWRNFQRLGFVREEMKTKDPKTKRTIKEVHLHMHMKE